MADLVTMHYRQILKNSMLFDNFIVTEHRLYIFLNILAYEHLNFQNVNRNVDK